MALYAWAFEETDRKQRWLHGLFPIGLLAISEWEPACETVALYPAALLLPAMFARRPLRETAWAQVVWAALLGGFVSWKTADVWPLLPGSTLLCAALLLIPSLLLCRSGSDRFLACALGGLFSELFLCLREYTLFSFCVIRLGSRESLSLGTAAWCLCVPLQALLSRFAKKKKAFSIGN